MIFNEIDESFVKKVHRYFEKDAFKSELPLSQNSKYSYFNKFEAALRNTFDGYLTINYASKVNSLKKRKAKWCRISLYLKKSRRIVRQKTRFARKSFQRFEIWNDL
ncbi:phage integrase SAM-like domain-containing protein [Chryseobacterium sp. Y16C]|uniref:phage integrase SAM-like domain-containing protein n=1 Tax=Chryseobacterium sp. Y16C TaxID=2920939 RepID=UPI00397C1E05